MVSTLHSSFNFFFFNDTATTEIYTLSLHDALPISSTCAWPRRQRATAAPAWACCRAARRCPSRGSCTGCCCRRGTTRRSRSRRSEEHTSELQSRQYLVCRLLLEKKKNNTCIVAMHS